MLIYFAGKMRTFKIIAVFAIFLLVEGKQFKKRQIATTTTNSRMRCVLLQVCSPEIQQTHCIPGTPGCISTPPFCIPGSPGCNLTPPVCIPGTPGCHLPYHCIPGTPGCHLPPICTQGTQNCGRTAVNCIGGFCTGGVGCILGTPGCQVGGYSHQFLIPQPQPQPPIYIHQQPCPSNNPHCLIYQRTPSQVFVQPPQVITKDVPYPVPEIVNRVNYVKQTVPQPYPVPNVVHVPVDRQVVIEKPVVKYVPQDVPVYRDRHVPREVIQHYPVTVTERVDVPVITYVTRPSTEIEEQEIETNISNNTSSSDLKNDANNRNMVNVTISVSNVNINNVTGATDLQTDMKNSEQSSSQISQSTEKKCCTVVGPTRCEGGSYCRRTRYQRCGSFCGNSRVIMLKQRTQPIYIPQPVPVPQPYPVPMPMPHPAPTPGSRCYGLNSYPYFDCRGCK